MQHPDEGLIHAWLDGELSPEEAARVDRLVREDPEWGAAASEARGLSAASSRILSALDSAPGDVLPAGSRAAPGAAKGRLRGRSGAPLGGPASGRSRAPSRFSVRPWMRVAAGLVLVVGTAVVVTDRADVDSAFESASVEDRATAQVQPPAVVDAERRVAAESTTLREETRETVAAAPSSTPPTAAASPTRKATSQSLAVAPAPAQQPDPFEAARDITAPTASPQVGNVARLRSERGFGTVSAGALPMAAGMTVSATVLDGCWRTLTRAAVDSVLVSPRIVGTAGQVLTILASEREVTVVQQADTLLGTIIDADGARVPFRAERIVCRD